MPRFLCIEVFDDGYEEVGFYTVRDDELDISETDRFLARFLDSDSSTFEPGFKDACERILTWIDEIGKRGLRVIRPRFEDKAEALPPKRGTIEELDIENPPLRLYYVRLSNQVLVLCGGGKKTAHANQQSGGLMTHFRLANAVANALTKMIQQKEIWINGTRLESEEEEILLYLKS